MKTNIRTVLRIFITLTPEEADLEAGDNVTVDSVAFKAEVPYLPYHLHNYTGGYDLEEVRLFKTLWDKN